MSIITELECSVKYQPSLYNCSGKNKLNDVLAGNATESVITGKRTREWQAAAGSRGSAHVELVA